MFSAEDQVKELKNHEFHFIDVRKMFPMMIEDRKLTALGMTLLEFVMRDYEKLHDVLYKKETTHKKSHAYEILNNSKTTKCKFVENMAKNNADPDGFIDYNKLISSCIDMSVFKSRSDVEHFIQVLFMEGRFDAKDNRFRWHE